MMPYFLIAPSGDAYENLARDELILNELAPGGIVLYLYVNTSAVIIGRNQNPYMECDMDKLNQDGVQLVRRVSGGGAVYHDSGNLNYSFIASGEIYDDRRQNAVILSALSSFGIDALVTGRNDITVGGLKVSGTAFCQRGNNRQQHGTLLVSEDLNALPRYLTPSKMKLEAKGIKSVRARVCNLNEIEPKLTVNKLKKALFDAFEREYGSSQPYPMNADFNDRLAKLKLERMSDKWRMGESPRYDIEFERRLSFGLVRLCLNVARGEITNCRTFSDCLDEDLPRQISAALTGAGFHKSAMIEALEPLSDKARELIEWIRDLSI